ncbi:MAG: retropepsin-like domain-containing protein [Bacteroidales bacterium]|jgi:hypothetical protein|nr:retropepsin-like domain-containing protein [Bacteroidales bacterium]
MKNRIIVLLVGLCSFSAIYAQTDKEWKIIENYLKAGLEFNRTFNADYQATESIMSESGINADCFYFILVDEVMKQLKKKANYKRITSEDVENTCDEVYTQISISNSVMGTEILARTANECMKKLDLPKASIVSGQMSERIPYIAIGKHARIKVSIGTSTRYYIVDSGADFCLISYDYMLELSYDGILTEKNCIYKGDQIVTLADGSITNASIFLINNVTLGSYVFNNVAFAIVNSEVGVGDFLLGNSVLGSFSSWTMNVSNKTVDCVK